MELQEQQQDNSYQKTEFKKELLTDWEFIDDLQHLLRNEIKDVKGEWQPITRREFMGYKEVEKEGAIHQLPIFRYTPEPTFFNENGINFFIKKVNLYSSKPFKVGSMSYEMYRKMCLNIIDNSTGCFEANYKDYVTSPQINRTELNSIFWDIIHYIICNLSRCVGGREREYAYVDNVKQSLIQDVYESVKRKIPQNNNAGGFL